MALFFPHSPPRLVKPIKYNQIDKPAVEKAMIFGVLYALPFVMALGMIYCFLLFDRAHLIEAGSMKFYLVFLVIIAISVTIHEMLHGIGWGLSSGKGWAVVRFTMHTVLPGCVCKTALITNFVASGADLAVAHKVLKERDALFADHPTKAGYIAFYK